MGRPKRETFYANSRANASFHDRLVPTNFGKFFFEFMTSNSLEFLLNKVVFERGFITVFSQDMAHYSCKGMPKK